LIAVLNRRGDSGIFLDGTNVTDTGLKELAAIKQLRFLHLNETKVTDKGVEELKKALPECSFFC
jgi:internalin A